MYVYMIMYVYTVLLILITYLSILYTLVLQVIHLTIYFLFDILSPSLPPSLSLSSEISKVPCNDEAVHCGLPGCNNSQT